jgi:hypothetical protein
MPFIWRILSQCEDDMEQKNVMYGQNDGFLHRKPRRVYSSGYNWDSKINIIFALFAL